MSGPPSLVDWEFAARVATSVAGRHASPPPTSAELDEALTAVLNSRLAVIEDQIEHVTGLRSLAGPAHFAAIDRRAWVTANVASFQRLLQPLLDRAATSTPPFGASIARRVTAVEVGGLLGWMSGRVLGQYDLLLGRDPNEGGRDDAVYLVTPNVALLEDRFGFDSLHFRTWVLLHELTHRAQFTGVPWMRDYFAGLVENVVSLSSADPTVILDALRDAVRDRATARQRLREHGLAGVIVNDEQRAAFAKVSGLMSLLEGHGDVVMSRAAGDLVPDTGRFERVLQARRQRGNPIARFLQRMLGIEAKLNQYAAGASFIAELERVGGPRLIDRCWESPEHLPTIDEIRQPQRWLTRVGRD